MTHATALWELLRPQVWVEYGASTAGNYMLHKEIVMRQHVHYF